MEYIKTFGLWVTAGIPAGLLLLFLLVSNPQQVPSALLVVPFGLLFAAIMALALAGIGMLRRDEGTVLGRELRRPRVLAAVLAAFPTLLLVLQSIGQLSPWDVATMSVLLALSYIYVTRSGVSFFK